MASGHTKEFMATYQLFRSAVSDRWENKEKAYDSDKDTYANTIKGKKIGREAELCQTFFNFQDLSLSATSIDDIIIYSKMGYTSSSTTAMDIGKWGISLFKTNDSGVIENVWQSAHTSQSSASKNEDLISSFLEPTIEIEDTSEDVQEENELTWTTSNTYSLSSKGTYSITQGMMTNWPTVSDWREVKTTSAGVVHSGPIIYCKSKWGTSESYIWKDYYTSIVLSYTLSDFTTSFTYSHSTVTATGGTGTITSTSIVTDEETTITLTFSYIESGYYFFGWKKNGTLVEGSAVMSWTTQPASGDTYEAVVVNKVQVTVQVLDEDSGEVCGTGSGGGLYVPGEVIAIQSNPDTYHVFDYWEDGSYTNPRSYEVPFSASTPTGYCRKKSKMIYKGGTTLYDQGITDVKAVYKGDTEIELKVPH